MGRATSPSKPLSGTNSPRSPDRESHIVDIQKMEGADRTGPSGSWTWLGAGGGGSGGWAVASIGKDRASASAIACMREWM